MVVVVVVVVAAAAVVLEVLVVLVVVVLRRGCRALRARQQKNIHNTTTPVWCGFESWVSLKNVHNTTQVSTWKEARALGRKLTGQIMWPIPGVHIPSFWYIFNQPRGYENVWGAFPATISPSWPFAGYVSVGFHLNRKKICKKAWRRLLGFSCEATQTTEGQEGLWESP